MQAYEFTTHITNGRVTIPELYRRSIPSHDPVRVIMLVNDYEPSHAIYEDCEACPDSCGGRDEEDDCPSLEDVLAEIKRTPQNPANIQAPSGLLAEHLMSSPFKPDKEFDFIAWNRRWDQIENKINLGDIFD